MSRKPLTTHKIQHGAVVLSSEADILKFVEQDCGAEGFTIDEATRQLVAVRWKDGAAFAVKRYDMDTFEGIQ
jgi:hypothetical protein